MQSSLPEKVLALSLIFWIPWSGLGCIGSIGTPKRALEFPSTAFDNLQSECRPRFPDHGGWFGGDAGYSVPLPIDDGRVSLWLFGDSFVQHPHMQPERVYPFVHNTIGISHCRADGAWSLDTFWRQDEDGTPRAFFEPDSDADWVGLSSRETSIHPYYWLFDGFVVHDVLFVGLLRVVGSEPRGPFNLPFRLAGMDLARIENYRDAPENWQIQISTLSNDTHAFPGSAFVTTASHLHAFAFFDRGDGRAPRMLSRLSLEALTDWQPDLSHALEYLASDSRWKPGFEPDEALIIMDDDASEMSVHFDSESKTWIAVYSDLTRIEPGEETGATASIQIRSAPALRGPWSEPETLVSIPEIASDFARSAHESLFCYAAKAHPQFSSPGELIITYVCNLFAENTAAVPTVLQKLRERVDLYRPRTLSVEIRPILDSASGSR